MELPSVAHAPTAEPKEGYQKPPIVQRIAHFPGEISSDAFVSRFEEWKEEVLKEFPVYKPLTEWRLQVEEVNGIPLFENAVPEVRVAHQFERRDAAGKALCTLRCPPDGLVVTLHSRPGTASAYQELRREVATWLPRWMRHFEVPGLQQVRLDYVNLLGPQTTPTFMVNGGQGLNIDKILNVFSNFKGNVLHIMQPYNCEVSLMYRVNPLRAIRIRVHGLSSAPGGGPQVRVDFLAQAHKNTPELLASSEALDELDALHDIVLEQTRRQPSACPAPTLGLSVRPAAHLRPGRRPTPAASARAVDPLSRSGVNDLRGGALGHRLPHFEVADVPHQVSRRFLQLFSKAEHQTLTADEQEAWLRVLDQVDYRQFYADRAAPQYIEGTLLQKTPVCRVAWHDGEKEKLAPAAAAALQTLEAGDEFSAFVKLDRAGKVQSIERVLLLEPDTTAVASALA